MTEGQTEEAIRAKLEAHFGASLSNWTVQRPRRLYVDVPREVLVEVVQFAKEELGFGHLSTITGLDAGEHLEVARRHGAALDDVPVLDGRRIAPPQEDLRAPSQQRDQVRRRPDSRECARDVARTRGTCPRPEGPDLVGMLGPLRQVLVREARDARPHVRDLHEGAAGR